MPKPHKKPVFVLLNNFPLMALTGPLEVYRHANRFVGRDLYRTLIASLDGAHVTASNGLQIRPDTDWAIGFSSSSHLAPCYRHRYNEMRCQLRRLQ